MADVTPLRINLQAEEVAYRSSVSEATLSRVGSSVNFINYYQHDKRDLFANGRYNIMPSYPQLGVDGLVIFEYAVQILNVYIWNGIAGSGGTTELDVKWKPQASGSYASMFSTTPKITSTAASYSICGVGDTVTGFTAPILSKTNFDAKDVLRLDIMGAMTGTVEGCGIIIHYRPR